MNPQLFISIPIILGLDILFFIFQKKMFENQIYQIQKQKLEMKISGAIACYLFLLLGLFYFVFKDHRTPFYAMILGFVIYGVFETTCYAILKDWKIETVMIDILWGSILFYLTTYLTYTFINYFK